MQKFCIGCNNEVHEVLKCPRCIELKLPDSIFCSQKCFVNEWKNHNRLHIKSSLDEAKAREIVLFSADDIKTWKFFPRTKQFIIPGWQFTGLLRPFPNTYSKNTVPKIIELPDYALTGVSKLEKLYNRKAIVRYTADEISNIREASQIAQKALNYAASLLKVGISSEEIDKKLHDFIISRNAYPSPLNYYGFPKSCCISPNEIICHGIPDSRPINEGDIINIDVTVFYRGMHGDVNATYIIGETSPENIDLVKCSYLALSEAIKICKPGARYSEIGETIQKVCTKYNYQIVRDYTGHGIGKVFHTVPFVLHYKNNNSKGIMKVGHVFTIEPMINVGSYKCVIWPDNWSVVTKDGSNSSQFEHTLVITEEGCEVLTIGENEENLKKVFQTDNIDEIVIKRYNNNL